MRARPPLAKLPRTATGAARSEGPFAPFHENASTRDSGARGGEWPERKSDDDAIERASPASPPFDFTKISVNPTLARASFPSFPFAPTSPIPSQAKSAARTASASREARSERVADRIMRGADRTGIPLPVLHKFERNFEADFSSVRVHTESSMAADLGALAFTRGHDVHVAPGQWAPHTPKGQELLGHELAHVLQQRLGKVSTTAMREGMALNDEPHLEAEADAVGARAARESTATKATHLPRAVRAEAPLGPVVIQRQTHNEKLLEEALDDAHKRVLEAKTPDSIAWTTRLELLLTWSRPANIEDDVIFDEFLSGSYQAADDEGRTLARLAPRYTLDHSLPFSGAGFPKTWAARFQKDFHSQEDLTALKKTYDEQKRAALETGKTIAPAVWASGLPLTLAQGRSLKADDIVWLVLNYARLATSAHEATDRYASAMAEWLRVAAYYGAVVEHEGNLGAEVRDIRDGTQRASPRLYEADQKTLDELIHALRDIDRPGANPSMVARRFYRVLVWSAPESLETRGGGTWPIDGLDAYRAEIAKVDAWIASASTGDSIEKAFAWAHARGWFGAAGEEVWESFKENGWKMAAMVAGILIAQAIPGVDVALDVILLIEFGWDAISTLVELGEAFHDAGSAKSVLEMEHASARMATTVVGTGAKIVQWLIMWAAGKAANHVSKWRSGKKFLEEHGGSSEARDALKKSRGDVEKAREDLRQREAQKREAEEARRRDDARKQREADAAKKRDEEAARAREAEEARKREAARKHEEEARKAAEERARAEKDREERDREAERKRQEEERKRQDERAARAASTPRSWEKFDPRFHDEFRARLRKFRGNDDLEPTPKLSGGEGKLFLAKPDGREALKRWYESRVADMPKSLELLEEASSAVKANPALSKEIDVVAIRDKGSDWIERDFDPDSIELKDALSDPAVAAARTRTIDALQALRSRGKLTPILRNILDKLRRMPPSANLHWSPGADKILIIDMQ